MSTHEPNPTHCPSPGTKFEPRGWFIRANFHPNLKMQKRSGLKFAETLADYFDLKNFDLGVDKWAFSHPVSGTESRVTIIVEPTAIQIQAVFPTLAKEWYEQRFTMALTRFRTLFEPKIMLGSSALVRGVLAIDGDARTYIANTLLAKEVTTSNPFGRPIHLLGLRFFFPPYKKAVIGKSKKTEETQWQVDVRVESLIEDPTKLFLEADADWPVPTEWTDKEVATTVEHIETVSEYLEKTVMPLLLRLSRPEDDDDKKEKK